MNRFQYSAIGSVVALLLAACGGGGGSTTTTGTGGSTTTVVTVPVSVVDGAIKGATVCLDKNNNAACDAGEPSAVTAADGSASLKVDPADQNKYPIVAIVPADAVDADHGVVGTAYVMKAPADKPNLVTPLTTMVQDVIDTAGATSAEAEKQVKSQIGVEISLFEDFTKKSTDDAKFAGTIARAAVVATQKQLTDLAGVVGQKDANNNTITDADLKRAVQQKVREILPTIVAKLAETGLKDPKSADLTSTMNAVVTSSGMSSDGAKAAIAIQSSQASGGKTEVFNATASAFIHELNFTSSADWYLRVNKSSAAQNTTDANGNRKYVDHRTKRIGGGEAYSWGVRTSPWRVSDKHWSGTEWTSCTLNHENTSSLPEASGSSTYNYCNGVQRGRGNGVYVDISDKTLLSVYTMLRDAGHTNLSIENASTALSNSTFPTGSKVSYRNSASTSNAVGYYPFPSNYVQLAHADLASAQEAACAVDPTPAYTTKDVTLEQLVTRYRGTPCIYPNKTTVTGKNGSIDSGDRNERWGQTTLSLGTIGTASTVSQANQATNYYTGNTQLRVAFADGNVAKYYACQQRYDGSTRNCDSIGNGAYSIETLGDARIMRFLGVPSKAAALNWERVFVERGGYVYHGYQDRLQNWSTARLNLVASNALLQQLGLPAIDPEKPVTLSNGSFQGEYSGSYTSTGADSGGFAVFLKSDNTYVCSTYSNLTKANYECTFSITSVSNTTANIALGVSSGGASFAGTLEYNTGAISGNWSNGSLSGTFTGARK